MKWTWTDVFIWTILVIQAVVLALALHVARQPRPRPADTSGPKVLLTFDQDV